MNLSNQDIIPTIDFIISKDDSFSKLKNDFIDFEKELEIYKSDKTNKSKIYSFFYNVLKQDAKKLNNYIDNIDDFKRALKENKNKNIIELLQSNINFEHAIDIILKNQEIYKDLFLDHPIIKSELICYKETKNTDCRNKIQKYFLDLKQKEKNANFLEKYIKSQDDFIEEFDIKYSGNVFSIPNNENSWKEFAQNIKMFNYKSFSVIENEDNIEIYFL